MNPDKITFGQLVCHIDHTPFVGATALAGIVTLVHDGKAELEGCPGQYHIAYLEPLIPEAISPSGPLRSNAAWRLIAAAGVTDLNAVAQATGVSRTNARFMLTKWEYLGKPASAAFLPWSAVRKAVPDDYAIAVQPAPEAKAERNPYEFFSTAAVILELVNHEGAEGFPPGLAERAMQIYEVL